MGKYEENLELLRKAVRCEPVDRVPVVPCGNAYFARAQHVLLKDYITDFDKACDANLTELKRIGADGTQNVIFSPYLLVHSGCLKQHFRDRNWAMMICGRSKSLRTCSLRIMRKSKRWDGMHSRNSLSQKNVTITGKT